MAQHAFLSPSAAHRWMHCTVAPSLEAGVPDTGSSYAEEGTLAHAYCAMKLKEFLGRDISDEAAEITELDKKYYSGELDEYTDTYKDIVLEKFAEARATTRDASLLVEARLDFSRYIPGGFGTADAIIIADGRMEVIDFKYGKGVRVSAFKNPQMMIYALGAYEAYSFEYNIGSVRMTIVQPRIDNLSEYELPVDKLLGWAADELRPRAELAFAGMGTAAPGEWCQFCKVKSRCKALAAVCTGTMDGHPDPRLASKEDMERAILPRLATFKTWLSGVEEYALQQALGGVHYAGFKLVEGRSNRRVTDTEAVALALNKAGYKTAEIYKLQELRAITELEKLAGKKQFAALCGDYIEKPQGKPALVPESDKRPAIDPVADDFKGINI